jgi:predicted phage terminase large subunit-like protein
MGTGEHGHRILIDDPINARDADATSKATLEAANDWYDGTVSSRGLDGVEIKDPETGKVETIDHARVIIMQRLHEEDLAAHVLEREDWIVLCIPERYYSGHDFAWRGAAGHLSPEDKGSIIGSGDRREEDELLWPDRRSEKASDALKKSLQHRAAGQLQQMPAPKEGQKLLRNWWRFYPPGLFRDENRRPKCTMVVQSVDCPLKDKQVNDMVSIQAWGVKGADRYLIDITTTHMDFFKAKRAIIEQARLVRKMYPRARHKILIENGGYGPELVIDLKRILTGVESVPAGQEGDKEVRAESAADDLQSGNCWLPGIGGGADSSLGPASVISSEIRDFIESCAVFPNGKNDDDVDAWSQCMNWLRSKVVAPGRTSSAFKRRRTRAAA